MTAFANESDAGLCANAKDRIIPTLERLKSYRLEVRSAR
jgi:hypothetical protein